MVVGCIVPSKAQAPFRLGGQASSSKSNPTKPKGSGSSSGPPCPPPPAPYDDGSQPQTPKRQGNERRKAAVTVDIGSGHISFYRETQFSAARFEAVCADPKHLPIEKRQCKLTRAPGERPIGQLASFLMFAHYWDSLEEHCEPIVVRSYLQEDRQANRDVVKTLPNGPLLISCEREQREHEPEEQEYCS